MTVSWARVRDVGRKHLAGILVGVAVVGLVQFGLLETLEHWSLDRMPVVDRALLRSAEERQRTAGRNNARELLNLLTPREFEVMQLVITGMLNKQIAGKLGTAEKTVKVHRGRAMQKLRVTSVAELVRLIEKAGITLAEGHKTKV